MTVYSSLCDFTLPWRYSFLEAWKNKLWVSSSLRGQEVRFAHFITKAEAAGVFLELVKLLVRGVLTPISGHRCDLWACVLPLPLNKRTCLELFFSMGLNNVKCDQFCLEETIWSLQDHCAAPSSWSPVAWAQRKTLASLSSQAWVSSL